MNADALLLTLRLAVSTTLVLMLFAIPLAWWIASGRSVARTLVQAVVALPLVLPPTVLGFYLLVALGPLTPPGRWLTSLLGHPLAFSFAGLLVGSILYSLPFAVQPLVAGFASVGQHYREAADGLGWTRARSFRQLVLPLSRASLIAACVLTFSHTVGEFGVVLMLGGNLPGATRTLSIVLFDQVQDFNYAAANRTAGMLLAVSMIALVAVYTLRGRGAETVG